MLAQPGNDITKKEVTGWAMGRLPHTQPPRFTITMMACLLSEWASFPARDPTSQTVVPVLPWVGLVTISLHYHLLQQGPEQGLVTSRAVIHHLLNAAQNFCLRAPWCLESAS